MVYVLLGTGFEETEAIAPVDLLRRAGVKVTTVGINGKIVKGSHGIGVEADTTLEKTDFSDLEMIVLPGGLGGVASCRASKGAMDALEQAIYDKTLDAKDFADCQVVKDTYTLLVRKKSGKNKEKENP